MGEIREILPCVECVDLGFSEPIDPEEQAALDQKRIRQCEGRIRNIVLTDVQVLSLRGDVVELPEVQAVAKSQNCPEGVSPINRIDRLFRELDKRKNS